MAEHKCIAVYINESSYSQTLLRIASSRAKELGVPWIVLYVDTQDYRSTSKKSQDKMLHLLTVAQQLGADILQIEHSNIAKAITDFVLASYKDGNSTVVEMIFGQNKKVGLLQKFKPSLAESLTRKLRHTPTIMQIIPLSGKEKNSIFSYILKLFRVKIQEIIFSLLTVFLAYCASELLRHNIPLIEWKINRHNVLAFFLIACVISSLRYGLIPSLIASIASFITINYFYILPVNNFYIHHTSGIATLVIFVVSAVLISLMGSFMRANNHALERKRRKIQLLYKLQKIASVAKNRNDALKILYEELHDTMQLQVAFFMPTSLNPDIIDIAYPDNVYLSEKDQQNLQTCWEKMQARGAGTTRRSKLEWRFEPMIMANNEVGVLGIKLHKHLHKDASLAHLIHAIAEQCASILERIEIAKMVSDGRIREEREKLRSMLLSSVSHDLKTPLVSIIGAMGIYQRMEQAGNIDTETAHDLVETTLEEAERLNNFISNILDMTRIETGDITFNQEWIEVEKPFYNIKKRLAHRLHKHNLFIAHPIPDVDVMMDLMMTEQVFQNIIDNAIKYCPTDCSIKVSIELSEGNLLYHIRDYGNGIPEEKFDTIFDKYERLKQSDTIIAGTGLGLAISRAIMEKQNGKLTVRNHDAGGAEFTLSFPDMRINHNMKSHVA